MSKMESQLTTHELVRTDGDIMEAVALWFSNPVAAEKKVWTY